MSEFSGRNEDLFFNSNILFVKIGALSDCTAFYQRDFNNKIFLSKKYWFLGDIKFIKDLIVLFRI